MPERSDYTRQIAFDCRYFLGDRPCVWHKQSGVVCVCEHYQKTDEHLLIIKLDAIGDVLRTTALLPALQEVHPAAAIAWITRRESVPLLRGNPYIAELLELDVDTCAHLLARSFDRVINLDASKVSASLAAMARSPRKDGFVLSPNGHVVATNAAARQWLEAGIFDDVKRQGTSTYQDCMAAILGLEGRQHRYILEMRPDEFRRAREQLVSLGFEPDRQAIGLNTGAGDRWPLKQWHEHGYVELIRRLHTDHNVQFVLLGGPNETERNQRLKAASGVPLVDPGCRNPIRHFAALVGHCDVVVTGDTLAMHIALALKRRAVILFGPTSAAEIETYGLGEKIVPDMTCLGCYKTSCDFVPNCMDLISVDMVQRAVERQLTVARGGTRGSEASP